MQYFDIHPGEVLAEELKDLGLAPGQFARALGVPASRISAILAGKRAVTADTALRIAHYFHMDAAFWMDLQAAYDLGQAEKALGAELRRLPRRDAGLETALPA